MKTIKNPNVLKYIGVLQIGINEAGEITNQPNSDYETATWTAQGYKPDSEFYPEWLEAYLDSNNAVMGNWD